MKASTLLIELLEEITIDSKDLYEFTSITILFCYIRHLSGVWDNSSYQNNTRIEYRKTYKRNGKLLKNQSYSI